jgi:hypothetical protein
MGSIDISSIREYNEVVDELPDGMHPNKIGYESMANLWFSALLN